MKIHIAATGFELTPDLQRYTRQKLKRVGRRLSRKVRLTAVCTVSYQQTIRDGVKYNTCELTLTQGNNATLTSKETTPHMYAALDVAVVHLEQQIRGQYGRRNIFRGLNLIAVY